MGKKGKTTSNASASTSRAPEHDEAHAEAPDSLATVPHEEIVPAVEVTPLVQILDSSQSAQGTLPLMEPMPSAIPPINWEVLGINEREVELSSINNQPEVKK